MVGITPNQFDLRSAGRPRPGRRRAPLSGGYEGELTEDKFASDFVVFVNIDHKVGSAHDHEGSLGFEDVHSLSMQTLPEYRDA